MYSDLWTWTVTKENYGEGMLNVSVSEFQKSVNQLSLEDAVFRVKQPVNITPAKF